MAANPRALWTGFAAALALAISASSAPVNADNATPRGKSYPEPAKGMTVVTLGTGGGPPPHSGQMQPSTLFEVAGKRYLVDAGEGAKYQMHQAQVWPSSLQSVFITHLHWDHTLGLDYLMASEWMQGREKPLPVFGPPGLGYFMSRQIAALEVGEDIFSSQADPRPKLASLYPAHDIETCAPSAVYEDDTVKVTAVCNSHFAHLRSSPHNYGEDKALSYRFDTAYGSVTFTGDTGPSPELERLAQGSDVLVSEIVDVESIGAALRKFSPDKDVSRLMLHMQMQHLTAQAVGELATRAKVKTVILTHYVIGEGFDVETFASQVAKHFDGKVIVARDLARYRFGA